MKSQKRQKGRRPGTQVDSIVERVLANFSSETERKEQ